MRSPLPAAPTHSSPQVPEMARCHSGTLHAIPDSREVNGYLTHARIGTSYRDLVQ